MSMKNPGADAITTKGWFNAHKWLILRRLSQFLLLALFLAGPLTGFWIVKGTLASSLTLDILPLTDPLIFLQSLIAGHVMETSAILGAILLFAGYFVIGGRVFCSWVCPINVISDAAAWLRRKLGWKKTGIRLPRHSARWLVLGVLIASGLTGTIAWEFLNPVTILHRALIFGALGTIVSLVAVLFLIELVGGDNIWCSRLCPVGGFYALLGKVSLVRISAAQRQKCDDCMDCYTVCPEPHVISPALKGEKDNQGPIIMSGDCTNCGRCIDVCSVRVFEFSLRHRNQLDQDRLSHPEAPEKRTDKAA